jgi:hypothetical protein
MATQDSYRYLFIKSIAQKILHFSGIIYGGYVRDVAVLHNEAATKFYEMAEDKRRYGDKSYLPEYKDRLLIPNDIDTMISKSDYDKLIVELSKDYTIKTITHRIPNKYFLSEINNEDIKLEKICISTPGVKDLIKLFPQSINPCTFLKKIFNSARFSIIIDFMIIYKNKNYFPPFGTSLDFECNGLYMDKQGIHLMPIIKTGKIEDDIIKFSKIIKDIKNHTAVALCSKDTHKYRYIKMKQNEWTIIDFLQPYNNLEPFTNKVLIQNEEKYTQIIDSAEEKFNQAKLEYEKEKEKAALFIIEPQCNICNVGIPIPRKMKCCSFLIHDECYKIWYSKKIIDNNSHIVECLMCKKELDFTNEFNKEDIGISNIRQPMLVHDEYEEEIPLHR